MLAVLISCISSASLPTEWILSVSLSHDCTLMSLIRLVIFSRSDCITPVSRLSWINWSSFSLFKSSPDLACNKRTNQTPRASHMKTYKWARPATESENSLDHFLHQALLEKTNKGGHSGHIYCYLPECVFMHILLFVVEVLVDIAPCNKEKT